MVVERAEGNAFFVEELVGAAAGTHDDAGSPPTSPSCCWCGSTASTSRPARSCARPASPADGSPTSCSRSRPTSATRPSTRACARPSSATSSSPATGTTPSGTRCSARPSTTTCCPASGSGCTRRYAAAIGDGRAPRHGRRAGPPRPAGPRRRDRARRPASRRVDEAAAVGGPDEAAQHFERALRLLAGLGSAGDGLVDLARLAVDTAEALSGSGHPERAAALLAEQLAALPADAPPTTRGTAPRRPGRRAHRHRDRRGPARDLRGGRPGDARRRHPGRAPGCSPRTPTCSRCSGGTRRPRQVGLDALALAEKLDLHRAGVRGDHHAVAGCAWAQQGARSARRCVEAIDRAVETGAVHAELRGRYLLARSYQDWAELDEAERWFRAPCERAEAGRHRVGAVRVRCPLAADLGAADPRRLGRRARALTDRRGTHAPPMAARDVREPARGGRGRPRRATSPTSCARPAPVLALEGALAIHAAAAEIRLAAQRGDAAAARGAVRRRRRRCSAGIWHPWFDGRIAARRARRSRRSPAAMPEVRRGSGRASPRARRPAARRRPHGRSSGTPTRASSGDPRAAPGWPRLDAETLRVRWLAGADDAPTLDALVSGWREVVELFEEFGDVYELARARAVLAGGAAGRRRRRRGPRASATRPARRPARLGAKPLVEQLRAIGSAPARHEAGSDALTPRETEILQRWSRPAGPTARSASSCSSAPRR